MAVHEITHPLIAHKLGLMRYSKISSKDFLSHPHKATGAFLAAVIYLKPL